MEKILARTDLRASLGDVFNYLAEPSHISAIWPKEFAFKLLEGPEKMGEGSEYCFQVTLLGQRFPWRSKITSLKPPFDFVDEAVDSPLKKWVHRHSLKSSNGGTVMADEIEVSTSLGPLGDIFAKQIVKRALEYRNSSLRRVFGEPVNPIFKDPLRISLLHGTFLSLAAVTVGVFLASSASFGGELLGFILGIVAWFFLWFFTHDLAHLAVGLLMGVRFSHYFLGLSNAIRLKGFVPKSLRLAVVVLGLRIDRGRSRGGKRGFAAMYLAGPLASMLVPFLVPAWILLKWESSLAGWVLLAASLLNLGFTLVFSSKVGCIRKALNVFRREM